jgi:hypothetical protein
VNRKIIIYKSLFIFLTIIFIFSNTSFAEVKQDEFLNKQKRFIKELYNNKKYFDCIAETQRLLEYKNIANQNEYLFLINACYYFGGQYKTVISRSQNIDTTNKDSQRLPNLFLLSHSYLNIGYTDPGKEILYKLDYPDISETGRSELFIHRAEFLIKQFEYQNILTEIENAHKYFNKFNRSFSIQDFKKDIEGYREIGLKSKWLSVSLSALLPGAGQVYSGRIMDGLLSLAAVAGSVYGACYFHNKKDKPMVMTFTFFSCLFYSGNLYGAYNSAEDTNKKLNEVFSNNIIKKYNLYYNPEDYIDGGLFK